MATAGTAPVIVLTTPEIAPPTVNVPGTFWNRAMEHIANLAPLIVNICLFILALYCLTRGRLLTVFFGIFLFGIWIVHALVLANWSRKLPTRAEMLQFMDLYYSSQDMPIEGKPTNPEFMPISQLYGRVSTLLEGLQSKRTQLLADGKPQLLVDKWYGTLRRWHTEVMSQKYEHLSTNKTKES